MSAKIIVADKQDLMVAGLKHLLNDTDIEITAQVSRQQELWKTLEKNCPDLLILDHTKINDFDLDNFTLLNQQFSSLQILVISADDNKKTIIQLLEAGVIGYLTKDCSKEEILTAIQVVLKGERFFCHKVLDILIEDRVRKEATNNLPSFISERETQIIGLIAKGNSTQQIAQALNLSHHTINSHRKNILKKLKIKSPTELVIYAIDTGLLKLNMIVKI